MRPEVKYSLQAAGILLFLSNPVTRGIFETMLGGDWRFAIAIAAVYGGVVYWMMSHAKPNNGHSPAETSSCSECSGKK